MVLAACTWALGKEAAGTDETRNPNAVPTLLLPVVDETEDPPPKRQNVLNRAWCISSTTATRRRTFLVFESCLRELFKTCQECSRLCQTTIETTDTLITVYSICPVEHVRTWKSQLIVNGRPAGNILLSSHLVFSGVKIAPTLRMLRHMNVQVISDSSFYEHRKAFALPAVHKVWLQEQQELLNELQNKEVDISADGRFDSPGFCAKYLAYTVHVEQINKILHSVQVQLKEASSQI
ncbi:hypothetical protein HPB47_014057 [Ixodes persulcatus]|uniref:Uncharacterized protein n=1 Tax=Ixodes persulcatus TaxID=34615 RepID=A0AC60QYT7_IXOPE|nr:hypothetical protein HPB47_014057 [Ixodes persulcatus]